MKGVIDQLLVGAVLGACAILWIGCGYLIQRYVFRNRRPDSTTVIATAMGATMLAVAIAAGIWTVLGYN